MNRKYDPIRGIKQNIALASMEGIGWSIPFHIAGNTPGTGAGVAAQVATVGSSLAGMPTLVHGSMNLIRSTDMLRMRQQHRRRR